MIKYEFCLLLVIPFVDTGTKRAFPNYYFFYCVGNYLHNNYYYETSSYQSHLQGKLTCSPALLSKHLLLVLYFTLKGSRVSAQVLILLMLPW